MFITKGYGITVDYIDWSCPAEMKNYEKAKIMERNEQDVNNWQLGAYIARSISTIGKGEYPKKPIFQYETEESENNEENQPAIDRLNMEIRGKILEEMGFPMPPR